MLLCISSYHFWKPVANNIYRPWVSLVSSFFQNASNYFTFKNFSGRVIHFTWKKIFEWKISELVLLHCCNSAGTQHLRSYLYYSSWYFKFLLTGEKILLVFFTKFNFDMFMVLLSDSFLSSRKLWLFLTHKSSSKCAIKCEMCQNRDPSLFCPTAQ